MKMANRHLLIASKKFNNPSTHLDKYTIEPFYCICLECGRSLTLPKDHTPSHSINRQWTRNVLKQMSFLYLINN